jgi:hypothetical protein
MTAEQQEQETDPEVMFEHTEDYALQMIERGEMHIVSRSDFRSGSS